MITIVFVWIGVVAVCLIPIVVGKRIADRFIHRHSAMFVVLGGYEWEEDDLIGVFSNPDKARAAKRQAEHAYGERRSHRTAWVRTATPDRATMPWELRD